VTRFFWLKPGTQAEYSIPGGPMLFDDCANANPVRGNYSWLCLSMNESYAVLDVQVFLEVYTPPDWKTPGGVDYFGSEYVEKAARGDLSFIKRIPLDQISGRIEIINSTGYTPGVWLAGPIVLRQRFNVTVDLDTMMMIGSDGKPWGRWILWIDPFKYPLEGKIHEAFIMNWLNTTINMEVFYRPSSPLTTLFGVVKSNFYAGVVNHVDSPFLAEMGWPSILLTYTYEPCTGIFLETTVLDFVDDLLTQKLGIVSYHPFTFDQVHLIGVSFPGDLNGDWVVNISDIATVASAFGAIPGGQRWNPIADINKDGIVNILDLTIVAKAFGTQYVKTD
jgi:hypothetical protein